MKRKGATGEPSNLKRFKTELNRFNDDHTTEWTNMLGSGAKRLLKAPGPNRKLRRKEERKLKKMRKSAFKQKKTLPTKQSLETEKKNEAKTEKLKRSKEREKEKKKEKKKKLVVKKEEEVNVRAQGLLEANKQEDKMIKQLEKQLKFNKKTKTLSLGFRNDGLDYLLNAVDTSHLQTLQAAGENIDDEDDPKSSWDIEEDDDDFGLGQKSEDDSTESEPADSEDYESTEEPVPDLPDQSAVSGILKTKSKHRKSEETSKAVHFETAKVKDRKTTKFEPDSENDSDELATDDEELDSASELSTSPTADNKSSLKMRKIVPKEDIYGRLLDEKGGVADTGPKGAYIPPGKRKQLATTADAKRQLELERIKKQLKGLLNRLSESTMVSVSAQVEDLYRQNSRMEMTELLADLLLEACVSSVLIPERLVMEHAMLIAVLHGNIATDIGAYFLQTLATRLDNELQNDGLNQTKRADNILVLLANLYNFKIVHSLLIFDILKKLSDRFSEKDIELILVLLKNVGFTLRKDDPAALKDVILQIQNKAANTDTQQYTEQSRVKFMLDVLLAIKNNNMRKIPNYDPTHLDHMRKMLRTYVRAGSLPDHQLRISLVDLLETEDKGRWWVVGSAWTGRDEDASNTESQISASVGEMSGEILELARQQRMNTDVRKNIFSVIITCEDFVDAFEKLLQLGLKNQQEREIIHVIIDLCLQERTFNPFYAFLTQKFCEQDRRFQMTTQFSLWDKFKELQEYGDHKLHNLAAYVTHLMATKALSLSLFKVIEFGELDKSRVRFMKQVLSNLLLDQPEHVMRDVFLRISSFPKLQVLREGIKLFMRHFLVRGSKKTLEPDARTRLEGLVDLAEKALTSSDAKFVL